MKLTSSVACTISSANYFALAATVASSYRQHHPNNVFVILIVDRKTPALVEALREPGAQIIFVEDIGLTEFPSLAFRYDIVELNTNVKPSLLKWLLGQGAEKAIYVDPDIYIYGSLDFVYELLDDNNAVVTPHATTPIAGTVRPSDQDLLATGTFNLGFIAVRNSDQGRALLDWWEERCLRLGFAETRTGLFVDQKWIDLAQCYFEGIHILKHPGCNMSNWNFHERRMSEKDDRREVNGKPLVFFHFSGIDIEGRDAEKISKHNSRYTFTDLPELRSLYAAYREQVLSRRYRELAAMPYGFGSFSDGSQITLLARRVYAMYEGELGCADPFDVRERFYPLARRYGLLRKSTIGQGANSQNYDRKDRRVRMVNGTLALLLRILGADRYSALMRYLSFISILRNQRDVIRLKV